MQNSLFDKICSSRPNYCHVIETDNVSEIESFVDDAWESFTAEGFSDEDVFDFLRTLTVYYWTEGEENESDENEVYNFDIGNYIMENLLF